MEFRRLVSSLRVVSPVCLAVVIFGCNKNDNAAEWQDALDASADGGATVADEDAGEGSDAASSTSNNNTQVSTANSDVTVTSTTGSASGSSSSGSSSEGTSSETNEESTSQSDESTDSTEASQSPDESDVDAGGDTTETDPTPGSDGCDGYLLCETFEDVDVGGIPDGWERRGEDVAVSEDLARGGQRALKIGSTGTERRIARDATILGTAHWARVYLRVELPVPDAFVHSTIVALTGEGPESGAAEYRLIDTVKQAADTPDVGSKHNWLYNVQPFDGTEWVCEASYNWEFDDDWHCLEYFVDTEAQRYEFYFDGTPVPITAGEAANGVCNKTDLPAQFEQLRVGWNNYQDAPPGFTAYLDDIAFDDQRIGCD